MYAEELDDWFEEVKLSTVKLRARPGNRWREGDTWQWASLHDELLCRFCMRWQQQDHQCRHDTAAPCRHCGFAVGYGSDAGPDVCWECALQVPGLA